MTTQIEEPNQSLDIPAGFYRYNNNIAWKGIKGNGKDCPVKRCMQMEIITRRGCPAMLYAKISIIDNKAKRIIGYSSDSTSNVLANQKSTLTLPDTTGGLSQISSRIAEILCY